MPTIGNDFRDLGKNPKISLLGLRKKAKRFEEGYNSLYDRSRIRDDEVANSIVSVLKTTATKKMF